MTHGCIYCRKEPCEEAKNTVYTSGLRLVIADFGSITAESFQGQQRAQKVLKSAIPNSENTSLFRTKQDPSVSR